MFLFKFQLLDPPSIKFSKQHQFRNEGMGWHSNKTHMNIGYKIYMNMKSLAEMKRYNIQHTRS